MKCDAIMKFRLGGYATGRCGECSGQHTGTSPPVRPAGGNNWGACSAARRDAAAIWPARTRSFRRRDSPHKSSSPLTATPRIFLEIITSAPSPLKNVFPTFWETFVFNLNLMTFIIYFAKIIQFFSLFYSPQFITFYCVLETITDITSLTW